MNDKLKNLLVRTASGVVLAVVVVGGLFLSPWSAAVLGSLIMIGCLMEFYSLCRAAGYNPAKRMGAFIAMLMFVSGACVPFALSTAEDAPNVFDALAVMSVLLGATMIINLILALFIPIIFVRELWRNHPTPIANISTTIGGLFYVALPMSLMPFLSIMLGGGKWSPWGVLIYVLLVWSNDVFAYLAGVTCGRHRMCERISPKKSWEGFVGGILGSIGMALLAGHLLHSNLLFWGGLGLVVSLSGVAGDFIESLFKRSVGVKDSGNILPGHGGFLDRFDALIVSVPFAMFYILVFGGIK